MADVTAEMMVKHLYDRAAAAYAEQKVCDQRCFEVSSVILDKAEAAGLEYLTKAEAHTVALSYHPCDCGKNWGHRK